MTTGPLSGISDISTARSRRISSFDRSGGNGDNIQIPAGSTAVLADIHGAGVIKHIWITIDCADPMYPRNMVLRIFWDGCEHPSVEAPIGDFFGNGWGMSYNFNSLPLVCTPRDGKSYVCYFPMPFGSGAKIEIENQSSYDCNAFYFYTDYDEADQIDEKMGRFHAWYNQQCKAPEGECGDVENEWGLLGPSPKNRSDRYNHLICECEGQGHFVGVNYYVNCPTPIWYGEGDDMFCVDGEPWPFSLHGTGTEDYFNQSWSPNEKFEHPYFGTGRAPGYDNDDPIWDWIGKTHCYRFHFEDPIRFKKSLRASIEHGHANTLTLEIATVAYWYQTMPGKRLPPLPRVEERQVRPAIGVRDVHRWRHNWRKSRGGGQLWGNEKDI